MRKKVKTIIKEFHDDNIVCMDITFLSAIMEYCKTAPLSREELVLLVKKLVEHGMEHYALTMKDYDYIISK